MDRDDLIVTKWTPGPWYLKPWRVGEGQRHRVVWGPAASGYPDRALAHTTGKRPHDVNDANAALIAAAPELYEALRRARECLAILYAGKSLNHVAHIPSIESIDAALSRATGVL